jgi:CubicO group peptidase (beta-lactamase class C family)
MDASDTRKESSGVAAAAPDGWASRSPEDAGLDPVPLRELTERIRSSAQANIHSVLVVRYGRLAYEQYFVGNDEAWGEALGRVSFNPDTMHDLRSVTKSVVSLLVGIALDHKLIGSIEDPVFAYFPDCVDLRTPAKDQVLLKHLLTMSSGLEWDQYRPVTDPMNSEIRMIRAPDPYRFALDRSVAAPPGKIWVYSSGATELLGKVVSRVAGEPLDDFARKHLLEPLNIADFAWMRLPKNSAPCASSGLRLRSRDLAKLGHLVLRRGEWNGQRIISARWIDQCLTPQIGGPEIYFYGFQWMLGRSLVRQREISWAVATGLGGQRLFVIPALDLIVAITAGLYTGPLQYSLPLQILNRHVLDAIRE